MTIEANWSAIAGVIIAGHGVASGMAADSPYSESTIKLQTPFFQARGLDLSPYFAGTLNVSIAPHQFELKYPRHTFPEVTWTMAHPPETFSFCDCRLQFRGDRAQGLIYYPHPETKQTHFQDPSVLEILMPQIAGIQYGDVVVLEVPADQIWIKRR